MTDQNNNSNNNNNNSGNNQNRPRHHHNRPRHHHNRNRPPRSDRPEGEQRAEGSGETAERTEGGAPREQRPQGFRRHNNNRPRHHHNRDNRDNRDNRGPNQNDQGGAQPQRRFDNRGPRPHHRNDNRQGFNSNNKPKTLSGSRVLQKYDNLLEQHLVARRKHYEHFGRAEGEQKLKLEKNFFRSIEELREWEEGLEDWQKKTLESKTESYKRDTFISDTYHEQIIQVSFEGEFEDPHFLSTQRQAQFADDTEESMGTIEDYKKYKGIVD